VRVGAHSHCQAGRQGCKKRAKIRSMCVHVGVLEVLVRASEPSRAAAAVAGVLSAHNES